MRLGIGVTSYNRADALAECLKGIKANTKKPYTLLVSDDGSSDNSVDVAKLLRVKVIANDNKGVARNKNRLIYNLHMRDCERIILLEDDMLPIKRGWEDIWKEGIDAFGSVFYLSHCNSGEGTVASPFISQKTTAQVLGLSRRAVYTAGFFNPKFKGFGYEHCEYQERLLRMGFGGKIVDGKFEFYALNSDKIKCQDDIETTGSQQQMDENSEVYKALSGNAGFVSPLLDYKSIKEILDFKNEAFNYV